MEILLAAINAKYIHSNLAVYSLRAAAGKYEPLVQLAEFTINQQSDEIFRSVYRRKPQLLFLSCYIWNRAMITELAENIHSVLPDTVIWAGGPEVSYDAEAFLREHPAFDGVMRGEGERTFRELLAYYVDGVGTLEEIAGITYRQRGTYGGCSADENGRHMEVICSTDENGRHMEQSRSAENRQQKEDHDLCEVHNKSVETIISNPPRLPAETLDEFPFAYRRLEDFEHRILYYESSRGCPFSCSYCLSSVDRHVRFRSMELVKKELACFLEHRVAQVKFVDRTFNCSHARTMELWSFLRDHDNGVTNFHFEIAADLLNGEELELLAGLRPGLVQLEIGVQTVNPQTLQAIHRTADFSEIAKRVQRIAAGGNVHQHLDLIAGLPYEDFESFRHSFDEVYRLHPQELQLGFLKVLRGSEMHRRAEEFGIAYRSRPPYEVLATRWISCDELLRLKEIEEMLEVYYNSGQFCWAMRALERLFSRPVELYEALADYYREHGLDGKVHSRLQRFEILRGFFTDCAAGLSDGTGDSGKLPDNGGDTGKLPGVAGDTGRLSGVADDIGKLLGATGNIGKLSGLASDAGELSNDGNGVLSPEAFDELLTLDLYLRENAKSRPAWAADLSEYREEIVSFYQKEEQERRYLPEYRQMIWKQLMRMTHLEAFPHLTEDWLLFDYSRRNPLTGDARVCRISLPRE